MSYEFLFIALAAISIFTSLTTEGVKKLFIEKGVKYSANILAVVVAVVLTIGASICYIVYTGEAVTSKVIVEVIVLVFLSFIIATCGYDKVIQAIMQIKRIGD